jgi:hypothetical protein
MRKRTSRLPVDVAGWKFPMIQSTEDSSVTRVANQGPELGEEQESRRMREETPGPEGGPNSDGNDATSFRQQSWETEKNVMSWEADDERD